MPARTSSVSGSNRSRTLPRVALAAVGVLMVWGVGATPVGAHDEISSSIPATGSTIEDPISTVSIDFGEPIADDVEMFLTYDEGGASIVDIGGTTVKTGPSTARLDFEEIDREGQYFVQYLATVPNDAHVMVGAISFLYGEPAGGSSFPVVPFVGISAAVLAVGAWLSLRRMKRGDADPEDLAIPPNPPPNPNA